MEIRGYVSHMGWRLWFLILLPLMAGGVAFALLADTPPRYEAQTVLTVPSSAVGGASSSSVAQYMANFEQAIVSDGVVAKTARGAGVVADDLRHGLQTTQLGSSSLVRVSFEGVNADKARRIVEVATRTAFDVVAEIQLPFGQSLEVLRSRVEATGAELAGAETRLQDFLLDSGLVLPREQYLLVASDVSRLEGEILRAQAEGIPTTALQAALEERRRELGKLAAKLPEYERLQAAVERAQLDVDDAEDELRLAENQLAYLRPHMTGVSTQPVPEVQTIGRGVAIATGAGLLVAIALVLLFPSRTEQRTYRAAQQPSWPMPPR